MIMEVLVLISPQMIGLLGRNPGFIGLLIGFLIILAEGIALPVAAGGPACLGHQLLDLVFDPQIFHEYGLQELKCTCPICQNMEHFQVDPVAVIADSVKQVSSVFPIDRIQRRFVVRSHFRVHTALVQIVPEQALFQDTPEMRELSGRDRHRALQCVGIHVLFQFTGDPEHAGVCAACRGRHYFGGIIQLIPF